MRFSLLTLCLPWALVQAEITATPTTTTTTATTAPLSSIKSYFASLACNATTFDYCVKTTTTPAITATSPPTTPMIPPASSSSSTSTSTKTTSIWTTTSSPSPTTTPTAVTSESSETPTSTSTSTLSSTSTATHTSTSTLTSSTRTSTITRPTTTVEESKESERAGSTVALATSPLVTSTTEGETTSSSTNSSTSTTIETRPRGTTTTSEAAWAKTSSSSTLEASIATPTSTSTTTTTTIATTTSPTDDLSSPAINASSTTSQTPTTVSSSSTSSISTTLTSSSTSTETTTTSTTEPATSLFFRVESSPAIFAGGSTTTTPESARTATSTEAVTSTMTTGEEETTTDEKTSTPAPEETIRPTSTVALSSSSSSSMSTTLSWTETSSTGRTTESTSISTEALTTKREETTPFTSTPSSTAEVTSSLPSSSSSFSTSSSTTFSSPTPSLGVAVTRESIPITREEPSPAALTSEMTFTPSSTLLTSSQESSTGSVDLSLIGSTSSFDATGESSTETDTEISSTTAVGSSSLKETATESWPSTSTLLTTLLETSKTTEMETTRMGATSTVGTTEETSTGTTTFSTSEKMETSSAATSSSASEALPTSSEELTTLLPTSSVSSSAVTSSASESSTEMPPTAAMSSSTRSSSTLLTSSVINAGGRVTTTAGTAGVPETTEKTSTPSGTSQQPLETSGTIGQPIGSGGQHPTTTSTTRALTQATERLVTSTSSSLEASIEALTTSLEDLLSSTSALLLDVPSSSLSSSLSSTTSSFDSSPADERTTASTGGSSTEETTSTTGSLSSSSLKTTVKVVETSEWTSTGTRTSSTAETTFRALEQTSTALPSTSTSITPAETSTTATSTTEAGLKQTSRSLPASSVTTASGNEEWTSTLSGKSTSTLLASSSAASSSLETTSTARPSTRRVIISSSSARITTVEQKTTSSGCTEKCPEWALISKDACYVQVPLPFSRTYQSSYTFCAHNKTGHLAEAEELQEDYPLIRSWVAGMARQNSSIYVGQSPFYKQERKIYGLFADLSMLGSASPIEMLEEVNFLGLCRTPQYCGKFACALDALYKTLPGQLPLPMGPPVPSGSSLQIACNSPSHTQFNLACDSFGKFAPRPGTSKTRCDVPRAFNIELPTTVNKPVRTTCDCLPGGTESCQSVKEMFRCLCRRNWMKFQCWKSPNFCYVPTGQTNKCNGRGTCQSYPDHFVCYCEPLWGGRTCEMSLLNVSLVPGPNETALLFPGKVALVAATLPDFLHTLVKGLMKYTPLFFDTAVDPLEYSHQFRKVCVGISGVLGVYYAAPGFIGLGANSCRLSYYLINMFMAGGLWLATMEAATVFCVFAGLGRNRWGLGVEKAVRGTWWKCLPAERRWFLERGTYWAGVGAACLWEFFLLCWFYDDIPSPHTCSGEIIRYRPHTFANIASMAALAFLSSGFGYMAIHYKRTYPELIAEQKMYVETRYGSQGCEWIEKVERNLYQQLFIGPVLFCSFFLFVFGQDAVAYDSFGKDWTEPASVVIGITSVVLTLWNHLAYNPERFGKVMKWVCPRLPWLNIWPRFTPMQYGYLSHKELISIRKPEIVLKANRSWPVKPGEENYISIERRHQCQRRMTRDYLEIRLSGKGKQEAMSMVATRFNRSLLEGDEENIQWDCLLKCWLDQIGKVDKVRWTIPRTKPINITDYVARVMSGPHLVRAKVLRENEIWARMERLYHLMGHYPLRPMTGILLGSFGQTPCRHVSQHDYMDSEWRRFKELTQNQKKRRNQLQKTIAPSLFGEPGQLYFAQPLRPTKRERKIFKRLRRERKKRPPRLTMEEDVRYGHQEMPQLRLFPGAERYLWTDFYNQLLVEKMGELRTRWILWNQERDARGENDEQCNLDEETPESIAEYEIQRMTPRLWADAEWANKDALRKRGVPMAVDVLKLNYRLYEAPVSSLRQEESMPQSLYRW